MWDTWPQGHGHNFREDWNKEGHINHPKRSSYPVTTEDHKRLQRATPAHNELMAPMNDFMQQQFANQDPSRTNMLILTLGHRVAQAAQMRGAHAQLVHAISRNFTIKDTNQIMEQLIQRCQGNLDQFIRDEMVMHDHCLAIARSLGQLAEAGRRKAETLGTAHSCQANSCKQAKGSDTLPEKPAPAKRPPRADRLVTRDLRSPGKRSTPARSSASKCNFQKRKSSRKEGRTKTTSHSTTPSCAHRSWR